MHSKIKRLIFCRRAILIYFIIQDQFEQIGEIFVHLIIWLQFESILDFTILFCYQQLSQNQSFGLFNLSRR